MVDDSKDPVDISDDSKDLVDISDDSKDLVDISNDSKDLVDISDARANFAHCAEVSHDSEDLEVDWGEPSRRMLSRNLKPDGTIELWDDSEDLESVDFTTVVAEPTEEQWDVFPVTNG